MLADAGLASATAMVGYARNAIVHDGRLGPGMELITKPFTRDVLLAARVRDILGLQLTGGPWRTGPSRSSRSSIWPRRCYR